MDSKVRYEHSGDSKILMFCVLNFPSEAVKKVLRIPITVDINVTPKDKE